MDKIVPGLALAAISALTIVAYKHPKAYRKIFIVIGLCFMSLNAVALTWHIAGQTVYHALIEFIVTDKLEAAREVAESYRIPIWVLLSGIAAFAYLWGLTFLPALLDADKPIEK